MRAELCSKPWRSCIKSPVSLYHLLDTGRLTQDKRHAMIDFQRRVSLSLTTIRLGAGDAAATAIHMARRAFNRNILVTLAVVPMCELSAK